MKAMTILVSLVLMSANAQEPELYPETVPLDDFPHIAHWQLTMVRQDALIDIDARGFEFLTRKSCIEDGIRRIREEEAEAPDFVPDESRWLGFVCEYFRPND